MEVKVERLKVVKISKIKNSFYIAALLNFK